ncbi:MAG: glycosyltransferase [Candidatus Latescibacterota bacterium]|nr:MAG: glycosyltransferase [Candidatus Latescibacterota bacterium]
MERNTGQVRALMVDSETTWRGGEGQLGLLIRGLMEREIDVRLAAPPGSAIAKRARELGVECLPLPIAGGFDLSAVRKLGRYLGGGRYDIIHCHSSHAHSIAFMANASLGFRSRGKRVRRPRLVVSRRVDFPVGRRGLGALKYRRGVDVYLAISSGVRDVLIRCGIAPEKIELVRSGIDLEKFDTVCDPAYLAREFELGPDTTIIGNIAALAPHKSQADFIRAAKLIKDSTENVKFLIVGEGELRGELEDLVRELDLERDVVLTGFREDVLEILSMFNCFVLSSYLEGLCTSIMDAQAMGIPVVATRVGGVPDLVVDGETGLLVPPRRPDLIAKAVIRMLGDDGLRERCVRQAIQKSRTYDYRRMVEQTVDAYHRILNLTHNEPAQGSVGDVKHTAGAL